MTSILLFGLFAYAQDIVPQPVSSEAEDTQLDDSLADTGTSGRLAPLAVKVQKEVRRTEATIEQTQELTRAINLMAARLEAQTIPWIGPPAPPAPLAWPDETRSLRAADGT